jgi:hypothetical protein
MAETGVKRKVEIDMLQRPEKRPAETHQEGFGVPDRSSYAPKHVEPPKLASDSRFDRDPHRGPRHGSATPEVKRLRFI